MEHLPTGLPTGLALRPLARSDAAAVTALVAACELHDDGTVEIAEDDIVADLQRPSLDLDAHTIGAFAATDGLVAYGEVYRARRAEVCVHPRHRGRGIGSALLRWTWDVARAGGGSVVGQTVSENNAGAAQLLARHGYTSRWTSWILEADLRQEPAEPLLPAGYAIRDYAGAHDDEAAYRVIEDAFAEWPDRDPTAFADWAAGTLRRPGFQPDHLALVTRGDAVVGACVMVRYDGEGGWVDQLAVDRAHRGRGLARALLVSAFRTAWRWGERSCGLATDSRTGALGLYEHVGMHVKRSYTHWARPL